MKLEMGLSDGHVDCESLHQLGKMNHECFASCGKF
jgi:hypothetical protein